MSNDYHTGRLLGNDLGIFPLRRISMLVHVGLACTSIFMLAAILTLIFWSSIEKAIARYLVRRSDRLMQVSKLTIRHNRILLEKIRLRDGSIYYRRKIPCAVYIEKTEIRTNTFMSLLSLLGLRCFGGSFIIGFPCRSVDHFTISGMHISGCHDSLDETLHVQFEQQESTASTHTAASARNVRRIGTALRAKNPSAALKNLADRFALDLKKRQTKAIDLKKSISDRWQIGFISLEEATLCESLQSFFVKENARHDEKIEDDGLYHHSQASFPISNEIRGFVGSTQALHSAILAKISPDLIATTPQAPSLQQTMNTIANTLYSSLSAASSDGNKSLLQSPSSSGAATPTGAGAAPKEEARSRRRQTLTRKGTAFFRGKKIERSKKSK